MTSRTGFQKLAGLTVFFLSFLVYLLTVAPEVTFWDSGELIYGALTLGIPHPPAYPMFCMIAKLFTLIPLGNAAYKVNLLSAVFGAGTVYLLFRLIEKAAGPAQGGTVIAAAAALSFAFFPYYWGVSVITMVYTMTMFLFMSTAHFLLDYSLHERESSLHASAFFMGLSMMCHQSALFILPAYVVFYMFAGRGCKKPVTVLISIFFFLLAFSTVLYLPIRAAAHPDLNIGDPEVLLNYLWVTKIPDYLRGAVSLARYFARGFSPLAAGAILLGIAVCMAIVIKFSKRAFILWLFFSGLSYCICIMALAAGSREVVQLGLINKFFSPAVLFGSAAAALLAILAWEAARRRFRLGGGTAAAFAFALFLIPAVSLAANYRDIDNGRNFFAYDFGHNTLKSINQDGVLLGWGDNGIFHTWYLNGFERYRDDVLVVHAGLLSYDWYMSGMQRAIYKKYDIPFVPRAAITDIEKNVPALADRLKTVTPTYYDFSGALQLKVPLESLGPQGLVHIIPPGRGKPLKQIWDSYVLRGAFDDSTNKEFAAEGILNIYGWESTIWAQRAYEAGRLQEAVGAYELSKKLGVSNPQLDEWMSGAREKLRQEKG